jgi:hypothetical protein
MYKGEDELLHYGTRGMRWGVRRYQNADGSLTAAGRKRYTNKDGTLNDKGRQYIAKEQARLKAERKVLLNQKRTTNELNELDVMRRKNDKLKTDGKKNDENATSSQPPKKKSTSDMTDKELQDKVNRLRNEEAYRDLNKKLGYDMPQTELDMKIAEMKKQKEYLELQRDINNLTPKKISKGQKFMNSIMNDVVAPAAKTAGKKFLENYLNEAGAKAIGDKFKEKADDMKKNAEKATAKIEKKEAKQQARQENRDNNRKFVDDQSKKVVDFVLNNNTKTTSNNGFGKDYEKRVDKMLADIDANGWDMYERMYKDDR